MRGIYKRGKVYWIRYAGLDGKVIRESTGETKFKDAQDLLIERKQAIKEGKHPECKRIATHSFNGLAVEYLKWAERQRCFKYKRYIVKDLMREYGNNHLRMFNTKIVEQLQTARLKRGNKPSTINRHVATLKHMFTKAVEWDMVQEEVLKRVRKAKLLPENNRRLRYLTRDECQEFINACDKNLRPIVITALNTGMRKGEILNLQWENVDLKHGFILLEVTKNGERREIPINNTLRETILNRQRRVDVPYVFYNQNTGKPYYDVKKSFNRACKKSGIKDFRFHDFRHTFASHLVMSGVDLTTVKELLGHKTLAMTLRYAHLSPSHKVKAVDILDSTLSLSSSAQKVHNPIKKELGDLPNSLNSLVGHPGLEPGTS